MNFNLPKSVKTVLKILDDNGYKAYVIGGCVRDMLLQKAPNDWDISTNALPKQIISSFSQYKVNTLGIKYGTITVHLDNTNFEITTFRLDGEYSDNRHPQNVTFTNDIIKDLSRRDFTINSMAYNEIDGLIDPFNGQIDLTHKLIKCVGNPDTRFCEDALRIMRAVRFSSTLNFQIEKDTINSMYKNSNLLNNIAPERISIELNKLLLSNSVENTLLQYKDILAVVIPEITQTFGYNQNTKHHDKLLWEHIANSVANIENNLLLRMTMLLHDLGKPSACKIDSYGTSHFKAHPKIGGNIAYIILKRLKYSNGFIKQVCTLICYHDIRLSSDKKRIKHIINAIGVENTSLLLKVQKADIDAQSSYLKDKKLKNHFDAILSFNSILENNECYSLKQLNINGNDLLKHNIAKGKQIGTLLNILLCKVINGEIANDKNELLKMAYHI